MPTVTTVEVPDGIDWKEAAVFVMGKYKIEIAGGLGASAGKVSSKNFLILLFLFLTKGAE